MSFGGRGLEYSSTAVVQGLNGSPAARHSHHAYRNDIQGLRAIAALLVVIYHVWFHRVSGAVDLFFFISAYFMTGSLLRRIPESGWREVPRFWGNLLKRMLPQAWSVILASIVIAFFTVPMSWWRQTIDEIRAATVFAVNWLLAFDQVNYLDQENPASIVQHYWAMSVQIQAYLVWPVAVGAVAILAHRSRRSGAAVAGSLSVIGTISFIYSIWITGANQPFAHFDTFARVWEFAAGGIFAVVLERISLPRLVRVGAGWVGLVGLVGLGAFVDVSSLFPGWIALLPISSAALIFMGGVEGGTGPAWGADRLLGMRPLKHLGSISYGIYLWHWPLLIAWRWKSDRLTPTWWEGLLVLAVTVLLAEFTTHFVEKPIRRGTFSRRVRHASVSGQSKRSFAVLVAMGLIGAIALQSWQSYIAKLSAVAEASDKNPGAAVLDPNYLGPTSFDTLQPALADVGEDWAQYDPTGCVVLATSQGSVAEHCWIEPDGTPTKSVMAVGDSHVGSWLAALVPIAIENGWRLDIFSTGGCRLQQLSMTSEDVSYLCEEQNRAALEFARTHHVDALMTVGNRAVANSSEMEFPVGFVEAVIEYLDSGTTAVIFRDQPRYEADPKECLSRATTSDEASATCVHDRDSLLASGDFSEMLPVPLRGRSDVVTVDMSDMICLDDVCPAAIGGVVVTQDSNHITATYVETMKPAVATAWQEAVGWLR